MYPMTTAPFVYFRIAGNILHYIPSLIRIHVSLAGLNLYRNTSYSDDDPDSDGETWRTQTEITSTHSGDGGIE